MIPMHPVDFGRGQLYFGTAGTGSLTFYQIEVPRQAKSMSIIMQGGGGRGGNGASGAAGTSRGGGGGGGGGASIVAMGIPTFFLPQTLHLSLAGAGSGLASNLGFHEGLSGSTNPVLAAVQSGSNGGNGTTSAAGAGAGVSSFNHGVMSNWIQRNGNNGPGGLAGTYGNAIPTTSLLTSTMFGIAPGGAGVLDTNQNGGAPYHASYLKFVPTIIQQAPPGGFHGDNGWKILSPFPIFTPGAGGSSNNTGTGGNGGNGGPGCGGGGAGAGVTGGTGGIGGEAWAWIMFQ